MPDSNFAAVKPVPKDLTIEQNADFNWQFVLKNPNAPVGTGLPINLTGYSGKMMIKDSNGNLVATFDSTLNDGSFTLGGPAGSVALFLPASSTASLTFVAANYDLLLKSGGNFITKLFFGSVKLDPGVTTF